MKQVRAKFRCMSVTKNWNQSTAVELSPVVQNGPSKENDEFWKATPSGTAKLCFVGPSFDSRGEEYTPGDYYYIDMRKDVDGGWCLSTVTTHSNDNGHVKVATNGKTTVGWREGDGFSHSSMEMGIDNIPAFEAFDNPGGTWDVQFTWAEASDD